MNIAYFIQPRAQVACVYDDFSLRQALEKLRAHGYSAIPVVTRDNRYVGTVSEGDFLWYLMDQQAPKPVAELKQMETVRIRDVLKMDRNPPVHITATTEELLDHAMAQNFVPVVDDRGCFVGIVTRHDVIRYLYAAQTGGKIVPERKEAL